jgi:hypothetical protein
MVPSEDPDVSCPPKNLFGVVSWRAFMSVSVLLSLFFDKNTKHSFLLFFWRGWGGHCLEFLLSKFAIYRSHSLQIAFKIRKLNVCGKVHLPSTRSLYHSMSTKTTIDGWLLYNSCHVVCLPHFSFTFLSHWGIYVKKVIVNRYTKYVLVPCFSA